LSNHNLSNVSTTKYAFQLEFENQSDFQKANKLREIIFNEFIIFLNEKNHIFDVDYMMQKYMRDNDITFNYFVFNSDTEQHKLSENVNYKTNHTIANIDKLPILFGNFNIANSNYDPEQLFFDINFIFKN